jgi:hypothetical protein
LSGHTEKTGFKCRTNKPEKYPGLEMGKVKDNGFI